MTDNKTYDAHFEHMYNIAKDIEHNEVDELINVLGFTDIKDVVVYAATKLNLLPTVRNCLAYLMGSNLDDRNVKHMSNTLTAYFDKTRKDRHGINYVDGYMSGQEMFAITAISVSLDMYDSPLIQPLGN